VESFEGTRRGATGDHVHHRSLDLKEVAAAKEASDEVDNLVSDLEDTLNVGIHYEIEVSVTVASVLSETILLNLVSSGKLVEAIRKELDLIRSDGELSGLGASSNTCDSNDITSTDAVMDLIEITLVVLCGGHDLNLGIITS
jgi:hypothetical protein